MGIDGKRRLMKHNSGFVANPSESLCLLRRYLPLKRGTNHQPAAHPFANLRQMRSRSRPRLRVLATTLPFQLTLPIPRSAGPRKEGALVCSKGTNLGPAQQSSAGLLHFERWQGNWIHRELQATENPVTRFPSGGSMHNDSIGKNRYSYEESRNLSGKCL